MSRSGDVHANRLTGERSVILHGTDDGSERRIVAHVTVPPKGAVIGEHLHPSVHERLRVVSGHMGLRAGGRERLLGPGEEADLPPGVLHDWWNAGEGPAEFIVEIDPADRFELMISTLFGLASDARPMRRACRTCFRPRSSPGSSTTSCALRGRPGSSSGRCSVCWRRSAAALGYLPVYGRYVRPDARVMPDPEIMARAGLAPAPQPSA